MSCVQQLKFRSVRCQHGL